MIIDKHLPEKYKPEYDVSVRRLTDLLAHTSPTKKSMGAAISEFQPGETIREHVNKEGVEEMFVLLDGKAEYKLDDEVQEISAGDVAFAKIGQKHSFKNTSDKPARLLSIWWKAVSEEEGQ
jgi:quercetin dioxygenase-like cupin family protein